MKTKKVVLAWMGCALMAACGARGDLYDAQPNYDSGWIALATDEAKTLVHNVGGSIAHYVVDFSYQDDAAANGINNRCLGGSDFGANYFAEDRVGAYWRSLTTSSIVVYRRPEDTYADRVRVRIWYHSAPDYDSGWTALATNEARTLTHNLATSTSAYVVDMQFRSATDGVNQRYYGGADFGTRAFSGARVDDRVGAYWRSLTSSSITVYRRPEDDYAPQVRVRIWRSASPDYDSAWVSVNVDTAQALTHNLGGSANNYVVDMQYRSVGDGVNQRYFGGADFGANPPAGMAENDRVGAYWRSLTPSLLTVYRRPNDIYASEMRIRIWRHAGLWAGATDLGAGWRWLSWFGQFHEQGGGWIYHLQHGWMFGVGDDVSNTWLYTLDMGWLWTSETIYPNLYFLNGGTWLYYLKGSTNPRWFYNWGNGAWEAR